MNTIKFVTVIILLFSLTSVVSAKTTVKIKALGSSPKGQFVAFEEFGYKFGDSRPYSRIRIMNMWKNKYIGKPIQVIGTQKGVKLTHIRSQAKSLAREKLTKLNIAL